MAVTGSVNGDSPSSGATGSERTNDLVVTLTEQSFVCVFITPRRGRIHVHGRHEPRGQVKLNVRHPVFAFSDDANRIPANIDANSIPDETLTSGFAEIEDLISKT